MVAPSGAEDLCLLVFQGEEAEGAECLLMVLPSSELAVLSTGSPLGCPSCPDSIPAAQGKMSLALNIR